MNRYVRPGSATRVFNRLVAALIGMGIGYRGSRVLVVRRRTSGGPQRTPVNVLTYDGDRYLVSPRGSTQWVRNLRAADGAAELHLGRRIESFQATEVSDQDKPAVLRAYLKRWRIETGIFFDGVRPDASEADLRRIAPGRPVFRLETRGS